MLFIVLQHKFADNVLLQRTNLEALFNQYMTHNSSSFSDLFPQNTCCIAMLKYKNIYAET